MAYADKSAVNIASAHSLSLPRQHSAWTSPQETDGSHIELANRRRQIKPEPLPLEEPTESHARYGWPTAIVTIIVIRAAIFIAGVMSIHSVTSVDQIDHENASGTPWVAFDGGFYRSILLHGYPKGPAVPYQIAYFPLYPYTCRLLLPFMSATAALLTVSNLCSLIGLCVVYGWAKSITNRRTAYISTLLLALYPGAVFYCASLTEGMFTMFVAIVMYLLTSKRMYTAALVCAVATACRPTAVALSLTVFIWTIFNTFEMPWKQQLRKVILVGMISVVGGACYQGFMWHRYHRFDAYKVAEDKWDVMAGPNRPPEDLESLKEVEDEWQATAIVPTIVGRPNSDHPGSASIVVVRPEPARYSPAWFWSRLKTSQAWNRLITLALLIMLIGAVIRRSAVPRLLLLTPLIIFLMSYLPNFGLRASSILRYESAGIPLFVVLGWHLAKPRRQPLLAAIVILSAGLELYYAFLFSRGSWIG